MKTLTRAFEAIVLFGLLHLAQELSSAQRPTQPPRFSVQDLGTLHGGSATVASSINSAGVVTGGATTAGPTRGVEGPSHPFLFIHGRIQDLGLLPGYEWGSAERINDQGQIIGYQWNLDPTTPSTAFLYTEGEKLNLTQILGDPNAGPVAINNRGAIVGAVGTPGTDAYTAFIYTNGILTRLGSLVPGGDSAANDINDSGEIAGTAGARAGSFRPSHAVIFSNGQIADLGVLPGMESSSGQRINRRGDVLGNCSTATPERSRGFLYRDGHMIDVGVLPGDTDSVVLGFNNFDQIVGTSYYNNGGGFVFRAVLYTDGAILDIQTLLPAKPGLLLQTAVGINDEGQILVVGQQDYGAQRTLLLTPTPHNWHRHLTPPKNHAL